MAAAATGVEEVVGGCTRARDDVREGRVRM
jgi:hypothetical protein